MGIRDVPDALCGVGASIELHRDHFPDGAADIEWIPYASSRGWVIVTQDRGIWRRPHERNAVIAAKARYVCVAGGSRRGTETAKMLVKYFSTIDHLARAQKAPLIARVTQSGVTFWDRRERAWIPVRRKHLRVRRSRH